MKIVIVAPLMDIPTTLSYTYMQKLKGEINKMGHGVQFIGGMRAIPTLVKNSVKKEPILLIYGGHSFEKSVLGQIPFWKIITEKNVNYLQNSVCIMIPACLNGQSLGQKSVNSGVRTWVGSDYWMYAAYPEFEHNYLDDFFNHWAIVPLMFINGSSMSDAVSHYKSVGYQLSAQYQSGFDSGKLNSGDMYADLIKTNSDRLRIFGDSGVTFNHEKG